LLVQNVAHPEDGDADEQADHRPVVLGHRGTIYEEPENTVQGFAKAADLGCDGFELDAFLLRCGTLVCFHGGGGDMDPGDLWDYCGVKGNIMDYTAEEARKLSLDHERKAFENFPRFKMKHATIPTLEEVLELVKDESTDAGTPIVVKIELKGPGTPDPAVELVERLGMQDQCYFSSFYHDRIARVRELRPQKHPDGTHVFKTGALFRVPPENFVKICQDLDATEVHLRYDTCSKERVDAIHDAGMDSLAWFRGPVAMEKDTRKFSDVGKNNDCNTSYLISFRPLIPYLGYSIIYDHDYFR
jgi:glycerophosphoryl diester phosphodiesterase